MVTIHHSYDKLQEQDIARLETELQYKLPAEYRQFLLEHNGGTPQPNSFPLQSYVSGEYAMVQKFLGIRSGEYDDLLRRYDVFRERIPAGWLPIAYDPGGNIICLVLSDREYGNVYFWDHEVDLNDGHNPTYRIADSFPEFLSKLSDTPQPAISVDIVEQACETGDTEVLQAYLSQGGNPNRTNEYGQSLAQIAAIYNHLPILQLLANHGVDTRKCLLTAAKNGSLDVAEFLLLLGADVNEKGGNLDNTSLMGAAASGNVAMVKLLLHHGADIAATNKRGQTAKLKALWGNHHEVVTVLEEAERSSSSGVF